MQEIMISIRGKWWDLIKGGEKPLELRKTAPKSLLAGRSRVEVKEKAVVWIPEKPFLCLVYVPEEKAVCGLFSCPGVEALDGADVSGRSRVPYGEQEKYRRQGGGKLYGWQVGAVEVFQEKKPLSEYGLNRPPQSWQYLRSRHGDKNKN